MAKKGTILKTAFDDYTIQDQLGEGGSGTVYRVTNEDGEDFAAKLVSREEGKEKIKRFKNEINFCLKEEHQTIVRVLDYGYLEADSNRYLFYIMPIYANSLRQLMNKGLQHEEAVRLFLEICDGLRFAHSKGCIHRDIKPENILIDHQGHAIIADFGIAHFREEDLATAVETKEYSRLANFKYHAPEQNEGKATKATDIYALGLILNEMFTRQIPMGENCQKIASVAPEFAFLDQLVQRMTFQNPEERYQSINDLLLDFEARKTEAASKSAIAQLSEPIANKDITDPLYLHPIEIKGIETKDGVLIITLSEFVNQAWENQYGTALSLYTASPYCYQKFRFSGNQATYPIRQYGQCLQMDSIRGLVNEFTEAVTIANKKYAVAVEREANEEKEEALARRKAEIDRLNEENQLNLELKGLI